jgi:hypothetical protein
VLSLATIRPAFPPWLFTLREGHIMHSTVDIRRDGSGHGDVVLAEPPAARCAGGDINCVASVEGTHSWLFVARPEPRLVNLLTGAVTPLAQLPDDDEIRVPMENARGIVYNDGTVFLFRFEDENSTPKFTAAILHPGDTVWTVIKRILEVPTGRRADLGAVYHNGKVLLCVGEYFWSLMTPGELGSFAGLQSRWRASKHKKITCEYMYVLESQGELLWALVLLKHSRHRLKLRSRLSMTIYALEEGPGGVMRWAVRDGWSLADRILFLGSPASFAVDAHRLGMGGGCAYFVFWGRVFRHNLVGGETEVVKELPLGCATTAGARVWIWRQPAIAPIQEIREDLMLHPNKKQKNM